MYLIAGLGNPESDYACTRHNMGFDVINKIAKKLEIDVNQTKFRALYGKGKIGEETVILLKPQTYMNLSGESIIECKNFYKIENEKIIVILDDIDLSPKKIRIKKKGSAGTHNGLKSVIKCLNSEEFIRVRVGVGAPKEGIDLVEYVIGYIPNNEKEILEKGVEIAKDAVIEIVKNGVDKAMNKYN